MNLQGLLESLDHFWGARGCGLLTAYEAEMATSAMHPLSFFGALGPKPWQFAVTQPIRRPGDGRNAQAPHRAQRFLQYYVFVKPAPEEVQETALASLDAAGIDWHRHDVRFEADDWEVTTIGAAGTGWQVWLDGMAVGRIVYYQQMGDLALDFTSVGLFYGVERLAMAVQATESIWELEWCPQLRYADLALPFELAWGQYASGQANEPRLRSLMALCEEEAVAAIDQGNHLLGYDWVLRASHLASALECCGTLRATECAMPTTRLRAIARRCAESYLASCPDGEQDVADARQ